MAMITMRIMIDGMMTLRIMMMVMLMIMRIMIDGDEWNRQRNRRRVESGEQARMGGECDWKTLNRPWIGSE